MYDVKRIRLVKLLEILKQNTDELNHMTTSAIIKELAKTGIESTRQTVYNDIKVLNEYGYGIVCVRHTVNEYYLEDDSFELPEMQILLDAVQAAKFITPKKTRELVNKIIAMGGSYSSEVERKNIVYFNTVKHTNEVIYYSINELIHAIVEQKKVTFNYFDFNERKEKVYRKNKKTYKENPCALVFSDDNYYLVAYSDKYKGIVHYRIDRMENVQVSEEDIIVPDDFDIQKHKSELFGMFTGKTETVVFETDKSMIDIILDQFGEDVEFTSLNDGRLRFSADVQISPKFISWVCGFGKRIKVLEPKSLVRQIKKYLSETIEQYE